MQRSHLVIAVLCIATMLGLGLSPEPLMAQTPSGCSEVVVNGGFEAVSGWLLGASAAPPQYVNSNPHNGSWSLLLGISDGVNRESFSSARQTITIPPGAQSTGLSFWVYAIASGAPDTDYMELALLSSDGSTILERPWYSHSDNRAWSQSVFDLSAWRGRTFQLYFNVFNDGLGGVTQMYLDDVSLVACPGGGSGGTGGGGLVTPAVPTSFPATPTRGACPSPVLPCFATPKTPSAEATPQPTQSTPAADQQRAQSTPIIIEPLSGGAATPAIIAPTVSGQESPAIITVAPVQSEISPQVIQPEVVSPPIIELTAAPTAQVQGASASYDDGEIEVVNPVAPSVTRIVLVFTVLPPASTQVQPTVTSVATDSTPLPTSTSPSPPIIPRRITDQWPKYWWLIPIGFIVLVIVIGFIGWRSNKKTAAGR